MERAIELQPNYADAYAYLTYLYNGIGRLEDADQSIQTAMRLNPLYPYWYLHARGEVRYMKSDFDGAVKDFEKAAKRNPAVHFVQFWLAAAYAMAGRIDDAQWQVEEMQGFGIKSTITRIMETTHIQSDALRKKFLDGLRKAGVPDWTILALQVMCDPLNHDVWRRRDVRKLALRSSFNDASAAVAGER